MSVFIRNLVLNIHSAILLTFGGKDYYGMKVQKIVISLELGFNYEEMY